MKVWNITKQVSVEFAITAVVWAVTNLGVFFSWLWVLLRSVAVEAPFNWGIFLPLFILWLFLWFFNPGMFTAKRDMERS